MGDTLCFTGYRPNRLGGFSGERATTIQTGIMNKAVEVIKRAHLAGYDKFISGAALGIDQITAEGVIKVRGMGYPVSLIMAIPFPSQGSKWPPHAQERYQRILARADKIVHCYDDPYAAWKMQKRNEWMVDRSITVVAFWAGDQGGTANCIRYARSKDVSILIINPYTLHEKWEGV